MAQSEKQFGRRGFLRRSAVFAMAAGAFAAIPAGAQEAQQKPAPPSDKPADGAKGESGSKELIDKQGRAYRICDVCGGNMYKQKDTWTCEQCGFSYVE
jgi:invasion protein IalB